MLNIDLGGVGAVPGWVTVNGSADPRGGAPDVVANIAASAGELTKIFSEGTVDQIRCIHTLEHLPAWDIMPSLKYWHTLLKPGGRLFVVVPDLGTMIADFWYGHIEFEDLAAVIYVPGSRSQRHPFEEHRWGWTVPTLRRDLQAAGYVRVQTIHTNEWPAAWTMDFEESRRTQAFGKYQVPNLRMEAYTP